MPVKVRTQGKIELDMSAMLDFAVATAVGIVQRRTSQGIAVDGSAFAPYSPSYEKTLALMGESPDVDLTVTGAYIASIGERSRTITADRASAVIGPDTGTSAEVRPNAGSSRHFYADVANDLLAGDEHEHHCRRGRRASKKSKRAASRTGQRSPPHNVLGSYLHNGTEHMPARPHLDLSAAERKAIADKIIKLRQ